jgi:hypothetical protein
MTTMRKYTESDSRIGRCPKEAPWFWVRRSRRRRPEGSLKMSHFRRSTKATKTLATPTATKCSPNSFSNKIIKTIAF